MTPKANEPQPDANIPAVLEAQQIAAQPSTDVEQWSELPAFDDGTAAFVEHFGLTAPRLKTDFGDGGKGFIDALTGEVREELNIIILAFPPSRSYWLKTLNEGGKKGDPPDCWSTKGALIEPDPDATSPQSATCAGCEHAKWPEVGGPRCEEAANVFAYDVDQESYYWLRFKRTSLKPFRAYVSSFLSRRGRPVFSVVTHVSLKGAVSPGGIDYLVPVFAMGEELTVTDVAPHRDLAQRTMKFWTAIAEEMAASEREGNGTPSTAASTAGTVDMGPGEEAF